ncbi:MAG: hypothetical protein J6Y16_01245 [Treponema sp.]|nr:hypothetical protein [Treponema sp.]
MDKQILIKTAEAWFEFSKSRTGQIDFVGKVEETLREDELLKGGYQKIASSAYFTPSYYIYLQDGENANPLVYVANDVDVSDSDTFDFLVHIGPLLAAVDSKDSLLAGELYLRRRAVFEKFPQLTSFIMEELCAEILFSLCYGKMQNVEPDSIPLLFNSAKKKLNFDSSRETLDQAFMRYLKDNSVTLTLPLVGTSFHNWEDEKCPDALEKLCDNLSCDNLLGAAEKIRRAKHDFYKSLECAVQAEPYNLHDRNAIIVNIENPSAKISGNPGLEKAGHIRALAAKIIREAKPKKMGYGGKLCSLSYNGIVVELKL